MKPSGILPALTTPFADDAPSPAHLAANIARYERLELGGYLVLGSTGEAVLLAASERRALLDAARRAIPDTKTLVAGVSAESTREAVAQASEAAASGADLVLVSTPHYFRAQMNADALVAHFSAVADASATPVLLYNVPKFTGLVLPVEVVARVARHGNVAGIKESSGDLDYLRRIRETGGPGFSVLCGDTGILREALAAGASGAILAAAAVFPEPLLALARGAEVREAAALASILDACAAIVGRHGVPGIKAAMDARDLYGGQVRAPLLPVPERVRADIRRSLAILVEQQWLVSERM